MKGCITFTSSDRELNEGFQRAKERALACSHERDLVGEWYEAALPDRPVFCIRNVAHQAMGAELLGLRNHTKNMLRRFVQNISQSREFCTFWRINKNYQPNPGDYTSDEDFYYNLPANFELIDTCYRMYLLTADECYIKDIDFVNFYDLTIHQYADCWDVDGDGILERKYPGARFGNPSYCEEPCFGNAAALIDMVAMEISGYRAAVEIYELRNEVAKSILCSQRAENLLQQLEERWWDEEKSAFYQGKEADGRMFHSEIPGHSLALLYYDVIENEKKRAAHLKRLIDYSMTNEINVESKTYYPDILFRCGENQRAYEWIRKLIAPDFEGREYPETAFSVIGHYICGIAGIKIDAVEREVMIQPAFPNENGWFEVRNCLLLDGEADICYRDGIISFQNRTAQSVWVNGIEAEPGEKIELCE